MGGRYLTSISQVLQHLTASSSRRVANVQESNLTRMTESEVSWMLVWDYRAVNSLLDTGQWQISPYKTPWIAERVLITASRIFGRFKLKAKLAKGNPSCLNQQTQETPGLASLNCCTYESSEVYLPVVPGLWVTLWRLYLRLAFLNAAHFSWLSCTILEPWAESLNLEHSQSTIVDPRNVSHILTSSIKWKHKTVLTYYYYYDTTWHLP